MPAIDQADFHFNQTAGLIAAVMVGFLVFSVALDLEWNQLRRVLRSPKAALIGLVGQFGLLPAIAFGIAAFLVRTPSVALGLLLVSCCPGGALSNYLSGVAKGDVATSVTMTAVSTAASVLLTPLVFALWASQNPDTKALLQSIDVDPKRVVFALLIMVALPVTAGMLINAKRQELAAKIRFWVRRIAAVVFAAVVIAVLGSNMRLLVEYADQALVPVMLAFATAVALGWLLARVAGLAPPDRRAVAIEIGMQNVALALGIAMTFFHGLAGVAITAAMWGAVHVVGGFSVAAIWARSPPL